ncbi:MAG TPA: glycoside hydrolase family 3 N-terminal domain-containing protein [Steroidobacteraceae bacterium]|nr:glycoside hydrolase family 3 N-terminal domain-containing protein [Steroidobacteraceae bacterium]
MNRIEMLIGRMTLAEKIGQLTMTAAGSAVTGPVLAGDSTEAIRAGTVGNLLNLVGPGPVHQLQRLAVEESRLKIPLLIGLDVIHGHRTLFPVPLAEAALFDPATWTRTAREAAAEAAADGIAMTFAPMCDVSRDPRWGRTVEGPGEDPWLGRQIAAAKVRGFQGAHLSDPASIAAVAKHFCAYGPVTAGREYAAVDVSERTVHEVHLPSFEAAVAAGVAAVMPAFTDLAGIPMTAHQGLLKGWLRGRQGFDGVIVSDYNAIHELLHHGVAADVPEAAALALNAGVDIDMMAGAYRQGLAVALERGLVSLADVDAAVRRVLTLKERLGLFDDPFRRGSRAETPAALAARHELAREVAGRSLVLLKCEREALPLPASVRRIGLIGPLTDAAAEMRGPWWAAAAAEGQVSVLEGLTAALGATRVAHARGVEIATDDVHGIAAAVELCATVDSIVLCLGEAAVMSGEAASRADPVLPGRQRELAEAVLARARALGKPAVVVLFCGRPLILPWLFEHADAALVAWFPGTQAGHGIADVLTGRRSPGGRTPISWPRTVGQVPIFFAQRPSGRPADPRDHFTSKYLDVPNDPAFAFGHGLTYGRFRYTQLQVTPSRVTPADTLEVRVDLTNEGSRAAEETVFVFTHDRVASTTRPLLELKGFARITLQPGASGSVTVRIAVAELRLLDARFEAVLEAGEFDVFAGPSADRSTLLAQRIVLAV